MDGAFGALLRGHRVAAGLTQESLAEKAAISGQAVGSLERGDRRFPHRDTVDRLAGALGLTGEQREAFAAAASRPSAPRSAAVKLPTSARPRQLPAAVAHFVGRVTDGKTMMELLDSSSTVVVTAISGMAGVGKTTFALHWAYRIRDRFPDGQLYVNLRGFDPHHSPVSPAAAVRAFLEALDVAPQRIPASPEAQLGLYRSLLAEREMLIVLDNAFDAEQIRPLLPGTPGNLVLVTSRNQLASLAATDNARLITLGLLSADEAYELLCARLGTERVAAQPAAAEEIIIRCGRLPLALAIVAAQAAAQPRLSLTALAQELREAQGSLEAFESDDDAVDVRTVFSCSYRGLKPETAQLFRLLGIHPGPDISAPAAASLASRPVKQVRRSLAELARANLIIEHSSGRYTFHDLLRVYATEQAHAQEPQDQLRAAIARTLDHYLHTAHTANRLLAPAVDLTLPVPQPGITPERVTEHEQALDWFIAEHAVLLALIDHAASAGFDTHTWQLAWSLTHFLGRGGYWHDDIAVQRAALAAARRLGDVTAQARSHRLLALDYTQSGRVEEAHTHFQQALDLAVEAGDLTSQAHTHNQIAVVWDRQGRYDMALHHGRQALLLFQTTGHRSGQADALNAVGWSQIQLGAYEQALPICEQALALQQESGNRPGQAAAWDSLGLVHNHLRHHEQAIACYEQALALHREFGNRFYEADVLTHLGDTHHATGRHDRARKAWQHALDILTDLDHTSAADHVRARLQRLGT